VSRRLLAIVVAVGGVVAIAGVASPTRSSDSGQVSASVVVNPLALLLDLSRTSVTTGQKLQATATVTNVSRIRLSNVAVELRVDTSGIVVKGTTKVVSQLGAGKSTGVSWQICATAPGAYLVLARASAGGVSIDSAARLLAVTRGKGGC
jgi:hypothetical protein